MEIFARWLLSFIIFSWCLDRRFFPYTYLSTWGWKNLLIRWGKEGRWNIQSISLIIILPTRGVTLALAHKRKVENFRNRKIVLRGYLDIKWIKNAISFSVFFITAQGSQLPGASGSIASPTRVKLKKIARGRWFNYLDIQTVIYLFAESCRIINQTVIQGPEYFLENNRLATIINLPTIINIRESLRYYLENPYQRMLSQKTT